MKHHHIIVELSDEQKKFQAFFKKTLKDFGVDSPEDLDKEEKKKFFNAIDKGFKSDAEEAGVKENREGFIGRMKTNVKLRRDYIIRTAVSVSEEDAPGDEMEKGAASDPELSGKKSQLVIEFPNDVRVEFSCKGDEIEDIKTMAQQFHDEGMETTEVASKVAEEFPGCTFEIEGGEETKVSSKKKDLPKSSHVPGKKKVKESFSNYISGMLRDPGKVVRERKNDKSVANRVERQLQRLNVLVSEMNTSIQGATPKTQEKLTIMVKENLEAISEILEESLPKNDA